MFEVDGRILRSLRLLLTAPGALTLAFSANQRASFITPLRLYLFTSLLFFFTLSVTSYDEVRTAAPPVTVAEVSLDAPAISDAQRERFKTIIEAPLHGELDTILDGADGMARGIMSSIMDGVDDSLQAGEPPGTPTVFAINQLLKSFSDPSEVLGEMYDNAPVALFFLLPVYALLLKLVYFRQHKYYVEHLVFGIHIHAVMFLMFTLFMLLPDNDIISVIEQLILLAWLIYYFKALRRYYGQSRRKTFLKYAFLITSYSFLTVPAIGLVMISTIAFL
ncbi:MAG: DUF3667 domain-containing protein [Pseudomonadota bacterium]